MYNNGFHEQTVFIAIEIIFNSFVNSCKKGLKFFNIDLKAFQFLVENIFLEEYAQLTNIIFDYICANNMKNILFSELIKQKILAFYNEYLNFFYSIYVIVLCNIIIYMWCKT